MPTVFSHPAPVLALAALLSGRVSTRMLLFGILCAVLPDADVIGFRFGISYADAFGHRGFSHSFVFALLMGCIGFGVSPLFLHGSRLMGFTVGFLAVSNHILLDAMTNGGHITYVEVDGDPSRNIDAFEDIIRAMKEMGVGYGSINHPVDTCHNCGYKGVIYDKCPICNSENIMRMRRITGYLTGDLNSWNSAKRAEEKDRVKHG